MRRLSLVGLILLMLAATPAAADPIAADRIAELPAAQRPAWEAYWDASQTLRARDELAIQAELQELGEEAKWMPAPTGRFGRRGRNDENWAASEQARELAANMITFQTPAGGWSKNVDIGLAPRRKGMGFGESRAHYRGTFDNNATIAPMRVLGRIAIAQPEFAPARESFLKGLDYILRAQYPNGGWPQVYPLEGGYHDNVTYNDNAMVNILEFMHEIAGGGEYPFVDEERRTATKAAIARGERFILDSQIVQHGVKTVWCAQHDPLTLRPTHARSYEWASLSGGESAGIAIYLMEQAPQTAEVRAAVDAAHAWFKANAIYGKRFRMRQLQLVDQESAGPIWARFYELETGRPMFVARNATEAVYSIEELPAASNGYAWYQGSGRAVLERYDAWQSGAPAVE